MRCAICGIGVNSIKDAVEQGWTPYFYHADQEHEPACPSCTENLLLEGKDGEMQVRRECQGKIKFLEGREDGEEGEHVLLPMLSMHANGKAH